MGDDILWRNCNTVFHVWAWIGVRLFQIMPFSWFTKVVAWLVAATGVTLILS